MYTLCNKITHRVTHSVVAPPNIVLSRGMQWARTYALKSHHKLHRMGAVLVANGNLHTGGFNKNHSHPRSPNEHCIHAEVDALIRPRAPLKNYDMFIIRLTRGGQVGTSKPCKDCMELIREADIDSITYIDENGAIKQEDL
jgi:deoxycytidylate deaminase